MINKKILFSTLSILSVLALVGGSAYAAVIDTVSVTSNTFAAGTEILDLSPDNIVPYSHGPLTSILNVTGIQPNVNKTGTLWFENNSPSPITLSALFTSTGGSGQGVTPGSFLERDMLVGALCTDGESVPAQTFVTWESPTSFTGSLAAGAKVQCTFTASYPVGNFNDFNQTLGYNAVFNANQ